MIGKKIMNKGEEEMIKGMLMVRLTVRVRGFGGIGSGSPDVGEVERSKRWGH